MQRREFSLSAASVAAAALSAAALPSAAQAQAAAFKDGADYLTLDKPAPVEAPAGQVEVVEFFWYSCPHCNAFEPQLEGWVKKLPADVSFRRVPVAFRDDFVPQQRLYYTLEAMGKVDQLHDKVFAAIHEQHQPTNREDSIVAFAEKNGLDRAKFQELYNSFGVSTKARKANELHKKVFYAIHVEKQALNTADLVAAWAEKQGINRPKFVEMYNSFSVSTKTRKATQLQDSYQVDGVPALGVGGRYFTSGTLAQNMGRALQVTDYLIAQSRKAKLGKA